MTVRIDWMVLSRRSPPYHDAGHWSEHRNREEAEELAKRIGGQLYRRRIVSVGGKVRTEIMKRIEL